MFYTLSACSKIPCPVFTIAHLVKQLIEYAVPLILIIMGMLDFAKATVAQDEQGIAKAKKDFVKRLISGCCVFFVMVILELVFSLLATSAKEAADGEGESGETIWDCVVQIFKGASEDGCDSQEFLDDPKPDETKEDDTKEETKTK